MECESLALDIVPKIQLCRV